MLAKTKTYRPSDKEPFMNERQREYFRVEAADLARGHPQGSQGDAAAPAGGKPESPRSRRPGVVGNRPRHRAARARSPAQADRQDRRGARPHRRRHLRLLRGDRRADRAAASGSAPDRDAVGRSAGAPRAARARLSRRLRRLSICRTIMPGLVPGIFFDASKRTRPPAGELPEAASLTPFPLARCENGAGARIATTHRALSSERQEHVEAPVGRNAVCCTSVIWPRPP